MSVVGAHRMRSLLPALLFTVAVLLVAPAQVAPLQAQDALPTLSGSRTGVIGPVALHAGLVIVHARSNGEANFAADLITQDPNSPTPVTQDPQAFKGFYDLFNVIGRFDGAAAKILMADDNYYIHVSLTSGPYQFSFEQPSPESVTPVDQTSFSGKGQQVTPVFHLPAGTITVTAQSDSTALRVSLFSVDDLGGSVIPPDGDPGVYQGRLIDMTSGPPAGGSAGVTIPSDGLYFLYVYAGGQRLAELGGVDSVIRQGYSGDP